jgi:abhydrolase domain-containing protein 17
LESHHRLATIMVDAIVNSLLFKPPNVHAYDFPSRLIHLMTKHQEQITATCIRNRGANVTIIFSHGNAEDLNTCYGWMRRLSRELNVNVVGYDYTGYGLSTGKKTMLRRFA